MNPNEEKNCFVCKRNENEIPLIQLDYKERHYWICPQHIPVLIHDPGKLEGLLPGAENFDPADS